MEDTKSDELQRIKGSKLYEQGKDENSPERQLAGQAALAGDSYLMDKNFGSPTQEDPDTKNKREVMAAFDKLSKSTFPEPLPINPTPPTPKPQTLKQPPQPGKAAA